MTVDPGQFSCHAFSRNSTNFFQQVEYKDSLGDQAPGSLVFWGPYLALGPGVYLLRLRGALEGTLTLDFACNQGRHVLKAAEISELARPICLVLRTGVKDLEIRALKSPALRSLTLSGLSVRCAYAPAAAAN